MRRSPYPVVNLEFKKLQLNKACKSSPLRCVKCRLVHKTLRIRQLRIGKSCGFPEVREARLVYKTQYIRHLRLGESCGLPQVREVQSNQ